VWWSLKVIYDKGLLVATCDQPVLPALRDAAVRPRDGQEGVYQTVTGPGHHVRFPLVSVPDGAPGELAGADLLVWTTTPWTLVSNTAVAVHPDAAYVVAARSGDGTAWWWPGPVATVLDHDWRSSPGSRDRR